MSADLFELLRAQMNDQVVNQLSQRVGATPEQTLQAAGPILATLVTAMSQNAAKPEGAQALSQALDKDHDGTVLDNITAVITGAAQPSRTTNGIGILQHLLGANTNNAVQMVSQSSGLDFLKSAEMMKLLAPIVMGVLGKTKRQQGLDVGSLVGMLTGSMTKARKQNTGMDIIGQLLSGGQGQKPKQGPDLMGAGMKILGSLLKK